MSRDSYSAWPSDYVDAAREFGDTFGKALKENQDKKLAPFIALAEHVLALELTVLPALKGTQEETLRALIWKARDVLKEQGQ